MGESSDGRLFPTVGPEMEKCVLRALSSFLLWQVTWW